MAIETATNESIEKAGYGIRGHIGGLPRRIYYTPDGREIRAIASWRTYRKKNGTAWEEGVRDANLDKGWLLEPPRESKPYCAGCDNWHDTEEEVKKCISDKKARAKRWEAKARKESQKEDTDNNHQIDDLKAELGELKEMVAKLLEVK